MKEIKRYDELREAYLTYKTVRNLRDIFPDRYDEAKRVLNEELTLQGWATF